MIMKIQPEEFEFKILTDKNVNEILALQERVISTLTNPDLLRRNTEQMFFECVKEPNYSIGTYHNGTLIGIGVLYYPTTLEEDLAHLLKGVDIKDKKSANYKLCMVDKNYRGNGLQVALGKMLEDKAKKDGINLLCATVSPDNFYSEQNMLKLGYKINTTLPKYGSIRNIFYKNI